MHPVKSMKTYQFAPISAREFPTLHLLDNPYIWGGVGFALNVSEKPYPPEIERAMKEKGIQWVHIPVSETDFSESWLQPLIRGVNYLNDSYNKGMKMVVHCDFGNNRSRTFIEAFHYFLTGEELPDEYKGEMNHLAYNCKIGHLEEIAKVEEALRAISRTVIK